MERFEVLLACDNPRMLKNIVCILEEKGCEVKRQKYYIKKSERNQS